MAESGAHTFHVAIIGAGIGGLALAMALHKHGVPFTLYEEAKEYSVVGAGIGFGPNGLRAMDLIEERFRGKYEGVCVSNKYVADQHVFFEGLLMEEGLGKKESWYGNSSWGGAPYTRKSAHRKSLLDIMTSFIPLRNVQFNKRLTSIEQHDDKVVLTFSDGDVTEASVVAGADGIQSTVREHVLEDEPSQIAPVYADSYCYRGVIPIETAEEILGDLADVAKFYFGDERSCVTYRISEGREFNFLLCVADQKTPWKLDKAVTERITHEEMMADFEGRGIDERLVRLLSHAKPIKWGFFHHLRTSSYVRNRVALVGDSAHASLPFQAAGAAQGLEDAYVLGSLFAEISLSNNTSRTLAYKIKAALEGYDRVRRPRAQKQLEQAAEVAEMSFFQHPETGSDVTKILPRMQRGRFHWLWYHDIQEDAREAIQEMDGTVDA